jgi:hypothetical protein
LRFGEGQLLGIDLGAVANDARDRAEPRGDAWAATVDEAGERRVEHRGVKLIGFAIGIDISAREVRFDQRRAESWSRSKNLVDETVFGAANRNGVEARYLQKGFVVDPARVRRSKHKGKGLIGGSQDLERRIDLRPATFVCAANEPHAVNPWLEALSGASKSYAIKAIRRPRGKILVNSCIDLAQKEGGRYSGRGSCTGLRTAHELEG